METLNSAARPHGETPFPYAVPTTSNLERSHIGTIPEPQIDGDSTRPSFVAMRSTKGMAGLLLAEVGGSMVEIDKHFSGHGSCFREGKTIEPGSVTPIQAGGHESISRTAPSSRVLPHPGIGHRRGASLDQGLSRQGTLLSAQASPERRAEELKRLLGDSSSKVKSGAIICSDRAQGKKSPNAVAFEQGKSRARVSLDLILENNIAVENGFLAGCVQVHVKPPKGCDNLSIGGGKIRIAGFEVSPGNEHRHIFYQIAMPLTSISPKYGSLFASSLDKQGFGPVTEGSYSLPFSLRLPAVTSGGKPRGVVSTKCGAIIKYIAIASMKIIDPSSGKRSIAHFYRDCEIWPTLDISKTFAPSPHPIQGHAAKKLFMGGDGSLSLSASLHRSIWVAGQPVHVRVQISNESRKTVRSLGLAVTCTTTTFRPSSRACGFAFKGDADTCEIETNERKIAEATLVAGQKGTKGHASAKGWWTGVGPGECVSLGHCLIIPVDALTVTRVRLLEVDYALRVNLNVGTLAGSSDAVHVILPIRVVSPISLDPPPSGPMKASSSSVISLDTPKALNNVAKVREASLRPMPSRTSTSVSKRSEEVYRSSSAQRRPPPLNLPDADRRPPPSGLPISSSTYAKTNMNLHMRSTGLEASRSGVTHAPVPSYPTSHVLHDFGNLESVEDLDSVLGDIPGSVSMLEESDISLGRRQGALNTGSSNWDIDYYEHEELASDEEIEMMVDCASARIQDEGYFTQQLLPREGLRQPTLDNISTLDGRPVPEQQIEIQLRREQTGNTQLKRSLPPQPLVDHQQVVPEATGRGRLADNQVRLTANRRRLNASLSPKRPTFSERVQMKKIQAHQISSRGRQVAQLREPLRCDTEDASFLSSDDTEQSESPESLYSVAQSSATPYSETSEDDVRTTEASVPLHLSNMRIREPSSDSRRHAGPVPLVPSRIKSAPVRRGLHTSSVAIGKSDEADMSPVRRRIAMLEEKTRREVGGPRPSLAARHTSSSIPSRK